MLQSCAKKKAADGRATKGEWGRRTGCWGEKESKKRGGREMVGGGGGKTKKEAVEKRDKKSRTK